ncbi:hypothetical protein E2562_022993 [Oryza meyeriana var. granulata]|uniref:Uncharacterized protein n=1 Tax=Oryza meyeriana var. granulata TaxID=110450 RepID=A0A6G1EYG6_9ORYZ|nr:hypothetical protein E2562_022993 [Oryza meyeriana var. granulata]
MKSTGGKRAIRPTNASAFKKFKSCMREDVDLAKLECSIKSPTYKGILDILEPTAILGSVRGKGSKDVMRI